jgi:erythronate-4-phosphate dehydrogenase
VAEEPAPVFEMSTVGGHQINLDADADTIPLAILAGYDVRSDAASLRRVLEIKEEARGDYFDALRNNYPIRREFKATEIYLSTDRQDIGETLTKLGFTVNI